MNEGSVVKAAVITETARVHLARAGLKTAKAEFSSVAAQADGHP